MSQDPLSGHHVNRFDFRAIVARCKLLCGKFGTLPRSRRYAVISVVLLVALWGVYEFYPDDSAQLRIVCQHSFRSAQLTVRVNGKLVCETTLTGGSRKRFGLLPINSVGGTYSTVANVPAGSDVVEVHVSAAGEGFDETRALTEDFREGEQNLLTISTGRSGLTLRSPGSTPTTLATASDSKGISWSFFSVLFSALGTMFSASVSFMVQEFWKSHKNRDRSAS